jgi:hypothetical protein
MPKTKTQSCASVGTFFLPKQKSGLTAESIAIPYNNLMSHLLAGEHGNKYFNQPITKMTGMNISVLEGIAGTEQCDKVWIIETVIYDMSDDNNEGVLVS